MFQFLKSYIMNLEKESWHLDNNCCRKREMSDDQLKRHEPLLGVLILLYTPTYLSSHLPPWIMHVE
jgi:hypothetical protein